jgi:hypothetical protein
MSLCLIYTGPIPPEVCDVAKCNSVVINDGANIIITDYQAELLVETSNIRWCEGCFPERADCETEPAPGREP